jgi:hypothetical protein
VTRPHRRFAGRLLLVLALTASLATTTTFLVGTASTPAQASSTIVWAGDHEEGSLADWTAPGGGIFNSGNGAVSASTDFARSGRYSAKMTIQTGDGSSHAVRLFRWAESRANTDAYYSAWYYFPQTFSGMGWWNVMQWKSKVTSGNDPTFVLNVTNRNGQMHFYLYDHLNGNVNRGTASAAIPVGKWVHVEGYYRQAADNTGRVTIWQDGAQVLDVSGVRTRRSGDEIHWSVNNYTDRISPSPATIYADDAAISTSRLGTGSTPAPAPAQPAASPTPVPATATPAEAPVAPAPEPTAVAISAPEAESQAPAATPEPQHEAPAPAPAAPAPDAAAPPAQPDDGSSAGSAQADEPANSPDRVAPSSRGGNPAPEQTSTPTPSLPDSLPNEVAATPEFKLGFGVLARLLGELAGAPLENEFHDPSTGNTLQRTSKGLMVWRKAENWTAFTNGFLTWINSSHGLQVRVNAERFDWEPR